MALTLVVLAAGVGSRYGGLKQLDPVGPAGETVLDYGVFDAVRAGFTKVVFVIRRDFEAIFRDQVAKRYGGNLAIEYAFQSIEALPDGFTLPVGREKPWGTGHALWCARHVVQENFAVINADDFYGADSFVQLARFLGAARPGEIAMVGFRLSNTLSEHGAVSRGICTADEGRLESIVEEVGITRADVGPGRKFSAETIVSMNCWGFTPAVFTNLDVQWRAFLTMLNQRIGPAVDPLKAEFYLPAAVSTMIARGEAGVRVLATESTWFGVTYRDDRPRVQVKLEELVQAGGYPDPLWP